MTKDLESDVYSTRTVVLANGALSVRLDTMWAGYTRVLITNVATEEVFGLVHSYDRSKDDLETLQSAIRESEWDCDDLNS
jgi:hypothetical protein